MEIAQIIYLVFFPQIPEFSGHSGLSDRVLMNWIIGLPNSILICLLMMNLSGLLKQRPTAVLQNFLELHLFMTLLF